MASSQVLEPVSRVDQVTSAIRRSILTGELKPGMPFKVNELANTFGTSIIPVREALQRLSAFGLIELRPGRTAMVSPLSADDLRELYAVRKLLEGDAIFRAAKSNTGADVAELERGLVSMADLRPSSDEFWAVHQDFHRRLLKPVLGPRLWHALLPLWEGTERYTRLVYDEIGFGSDEHIPDAAHRPIVEAVAAGNAKRARAALLEHYDHNLAWMLHGLSAVDSAAVRQST
jgi:DNA-binding GntR family transcriptional regulator